MCWEELKFSDRFGLTSVIAPSAAIVWRLSWRPETDTRSSMRRGNAREEVKDILSRVVVSRDHEPTKVWRRVAADCRREGTHIRYTSQGGESMATQSFLDMIEEFGTGLGVPKVDVDKLIEVHRRNIDALGRSAQVATEGAKSLADKQREIIETAFRETSAMVRDFKPTGDPQEMLVKQTEFARKAFDITLQNSRDIAELAMKTTSDATAIVRERLRESLSELRNSVSLAGSEMPKKT